MVIWSKNHKRNLIDVLIVALVVVAICSLVWDALGKDMTKNILTALVWAGIAFCCNRLRNWHLERRLRDAVEDVHQGAVTGIAPGRLSKGTVDILLRNRTDVPINIREVRLCQLPHPCKSPLIRLKYHGPSLHVYNADRDDPGGDYRPKPDGEKQLWELTNRKAADWHEIAPHAAAYFGLSVESLKSLLDLENDFECLIFLDYPTIFGGRRVIEVRVNRKGTLFIKRFLTDAYDLVSEMEAKMAELKKAEAESST